MLLFSEFLDDGSMSKKETAGDALKDGLADRKPLCNPWEKGVTQTPRKVFVAPHDNGGMKDGE